MAHDQTYVVDNINLSASIGTEGNIVSLSISGYMIDACGNIGHCEDISLAGPSSLEHKQTILNIAKQKISDSITAVSFDFENDELIAIETAYRQF